MWWKENIEEDKKHLVAKLKEELDKVDRCYFLNRSKHNINYGVNGEVGQGYYSIKAPYLPEPVREIIEQITKPEVKGMLFELAVVNWYTEGGYIPPHVDRDDFLCFGVMPLEDKAGVFTYYEENDLEKGVDIEDVAGQIIYTDNIMNLHSCKANKERYSLVTLYC